MTENRKLKVVRKRHQKNRIHHYRSEIVALKMEIARWKRWAEYANSEYRKATGSDIPQDQAA